jgi:hypothetical protein
MNPTDTSRLLAATVLIGSAAILFLVGRDLERDTIKPPPFPEKTEFSLAAHQPVNRLFSTEELVRLQPAPDTINPFYTAHFEPPPKPKPKPPPPAAKTRKVNLLYQGFFKTAGGEPMAYVLVDKETVVGTIGAKVVADYEIAGISMQGLTLKGGEDETVLPFREEKQIEIPIK